MSEPENEQELQEYCSGIRRRLALWQELSGGSLDTSIPGAGALIGLLGDEGQVQAGDVNGGEVVVAPAVEDEVNATSKSQNAGVSSKKRKVDDSTEDEDRGEEDITKRMKVPRNGPVVTASPDESDLNAFGLPFRHQTQVHSTQAGQPPVVNSAASPNPDSINPSQVTDPPLDNSQPNGGYANQPPALDTTTRSNTSARPLPTPILSDADPLHRPDNENSEAELRAAQLGLEIQQKWLDKIRILWLSPEENGDPNKAIEFPVGYKLYVYTREKGPRKGWLDYCMYGHPGHYKFRSIVGFFEHWKGLARGEVHGQNGYRCRCKGCK